MAVSVRDEWFDQQVLDLLDDVHVLTLATFHHDTGPWAADVFFARNGLDLVFLSSARSRHAQDLAADARCAVTIHPESPTWQSIRGVQLRGRARAVTGAVEIARLLGAYFGRFPFAQAIVGNPVGATARAAGARPYVFTPEWVRLIDNTRGFGRPFEAAIRDGVIAHAEQRVVPPV